MENYLWFFSVHNNQSANCYFHKVYWNKFLFTVPKLTSIAVENLIPSFIHYLIKYNNKNNFKTKLYTIIC